MPTSSRKFRLTITLGNDAMQTRDDVADALEKIAKRVRAMPCYGDTRPIFDINGNSVGEWTWPEKE